MCIFAMYLIHQIRKIDMVNGQLQHGGYRKQIHAGTCRMLLKGRSDSIVHGIVGNVNRVIRNIFSSHGSIQEIKFKMFEHIRRKIQNCRLKVPESIVGLHFNH